MRVEADAIVDDTLACLGKAVCSPATERILPENIADLAYDAWEAARNHIYEEWLEGTDTAKMQPSIPKPMREAAELLNAHPPKDLSGERLYELLDTIEAPYDTRTQSMMRKTLDAHEAPRDKVSAVIALVEELGLQPPPEVKPLPEIEEGDVNLVAWMALVPESV